MKHLKTSMIVMMLALSSLLGLAGCGEDHGYRYNDDRNRSVHYEGQEGYRHNDQYNHYDSDRHEYNGGNYSHENQHDDR